MGPSLDVARPRNLDWKRAAALLYGDWGTSKAYVIGYAFLALGFASLSTIIYVSLITGLVGLNYMVVCRYFPDGGGVYSAARVHGRALAVVGALLLVADLAVTAALSGYDALKYLYPAIDDGWAPQWTVLVIVAFGILNSYGPRHSGGLAVALAIPMSILVVVLIAFAIPSLTTHLAPMPAGHTISGSWHAFVASILALSGVEAIANLTGVMKLDPGSTTEHPSVGREARRAILPVAIEVVVCTAILGWATMSLWGKDSLMQPGHTMMERLTTDNSHVLRVLGEEYGAGHFGQTFGHYSGWIVGIVVGMLLLSAVNTAIAALIGVLYTLARDGEMPRPFLALNKHGVPFLPLLVAIGLPSGIMLCTNLDPKNAMEHLGELYAIGVVGAITVNLGSCAFNKSLSLKTYERALLFFTFGILFCVEITLAYDKHLALFFVVVILGVGFWLRSMSHKASGLATITVARELADTVRPEVIDRLRPTPLVEGRKILVAARGATPVLKFALNEAGLHKAVLCVLYVREIAVLLGGTQPTRGGGRPRWQDDPNAAAIMSLIMKLGEEINVCVQPIYVVSNDPSGTIVDVAATLGADMVMLGAPHRSGMARLLKGNVVENVASQLPENIELIIHG